MIVLDLSGRVPIYEQIKNQIMELILAEVLKPHEQLPSIRNLASDLKINVNTVKKAFMDLELMGVIYTQTGKGSFVSERAGENTIIKDRWIQNIKTAISEGKATGVTKDDLLQIISKIYNDV